MTGSAAEPKSTRWLLAKYSDIAERLPALKEPVSKGAAISYTQWEAWLALYHGVRLVVAEADATAPRDAKFAPTDASRAAQAGHLAMLRASECYPACRFTGPDNLAKHLFASEMLDILSEEHRRALRRQPSNLPYPSLGPLFKGREPFMETLHTTLTRGGSTAATAVVGKALHGLGGIGKTRLAVEYAHRQAAEYSALLFVAADTAERLDATLAALVGADVLDLP